MPAGDIHTPANFFAFSAALKSFKTLALATGLQYNTIDTEPVCLPERRPQCRQKPTPSTAG
jgi:hypothetical protein